MPDVGQLLDSLKSWCSQNYGWAIGLIIQSFIAYHVFFLSKKLSNKDRLDHKEVIKLKADELLSKIHSKGLNSEVYLVNSKRYFKDYPANDTQRFESYSHIRAEIKATRFDGIEFFSGMPMEVYRTRRGRLSFKGKREEKVFNVFPVGLVPYEWIEYVDLEGDEFGYVPLIHCYFKGKRNKNFWKRLLFFKYPYKREAFYRQSETFDEKRDPPCLKYRLVEERISKR